MASKGVKTRPFQGALTNILELVTITAPAHSNPVQKHWFGTYYGPETAKQ